MHLLEVPLFLFYIIDIFVGEEIALHVSSFAFLLERRLSGNKMLIKDVAEYQTDIRYHTDAKWVGNDWLVHLSLGVISDKSFRERRPNKSQGL